MRYPVTNQEYRQFLDETGHTSLPTSWVFGAFPSDRANHPVYTITPGDAEAYAGWLSVRTGRRFRLPTEVEWEYAARGRDEREFPWGDSFDAAKANTVELRLLSTTPVGMFSQGASPFGLLDLAGNVEEYVADVYEPYPGGPLVTD